MEKVIVYRSQTEQNQDEFIQMIFGWIVEHPIAVLITLGVIILTAMIYNKRK